MYISIEPQLHVSLWTFSPSFFFPTGMKRTNQRDVPAYLPVNLFMTHPWKCPEINHFSPMALVQSPSSPLVREELTEKGSKREIKKKKEGEEKRRLADPRDGVSQLAQWYSISRRCCSGTIRKSKYQMCLRTSTGSANGAQFSWADKNWRESVKKKRISFATVMWPPNPDVILL